MVAVVPGSLDQETPDMDVAGFGDGSPMLSVTGGVLRGDKPEVGHECARRGEAIDVIDLADNGEGSEDFHAAQTAERFDFTSIERRLGIAFEFCVHAQKLGLKILQMLELHGQRSCQRSLECQAMSGKPHAVLLGPCGLSFVEDKTVVTEDA
jgi:hypothetical protein